VRAIGRRGYGLLQAGEAVDEVVNAGQGQDAVDGTVRGNDEPQLAAFARTRLCAAIRAWTAAESQNRVRVMSTTSVRYRFSVAARRTARSCSAVVTISGALPSRARHRSSCGDT
jgi:hypothetical protein